MIVTTARLLTRRRRLAILTGIDSNLRLLILDFTRLLNGRNDLTRLDLALLSLLRNPNEPVEEQSADDVDQDVDPEDTEVAPSLAVLVVNQLEECVGVAEWAVFTAGCSWTIDTQPRRPGQMKRNTRGGRSGTYGVDSGTCVVDESKHTRDT